MDQSSVRSSHLRPWTNTPSATATIVSSSKREKKLPSGAMVMGNRWKQLKTRSERQLEVGLVCSRRTAIRPARTGSWAVLGRVVQVPGNRTKCQQHELSVTFNLVPLIINLLKLPRQSDSSTSLSCRGTVEANQVTALATQAKGKGDAHHPLRYEPTSQPDPPPSKPIAPHLILSTGTMYIPQHSMTK